MKTATGISIRRANERGHAQYDWLNTYHTFSFADYYNPDFMSYRALRVINDDTIVGAGGFGMHPHHDMEIITYVLSGELEHRDSMGNSGVITAGDVQYMSAGTGVRHSEFNRSATEPVHLLQIWIFPDELGVTPHYEQKSFANAPLNQLHLVASKDGRDGSISIHQDAELFLAKLASGGSVEFHLDSRRYAWLQVAEGELTFNGEKLYTGDGVAVDEEMKLELSATKPSQMLLFDLP